jgi:hypothetical protein
MICLTAGRYATIPPLVYADSDACFYPYFEVNFFLERKLKAWYSMRTEVELQDYRRTPDELPEVKNVSNGYLFCYTHPPSKARDFHCRSHVRTLKCGGGLKHVLCSRQTPVPKVSPGERLYLEEPNEEVQATINLHGAFRGVEPNNHGAETLLQPRPGECLDRGRSPSRLLPFTSASAGAASRSCTVHGAR